MTNLSPSGPRAEKGKEPGHTDHLNKPGGFFPRKLRSSGDHRETPASEPALSCQACEDKMVSPTNTHKRRRLYLIIVGL